MSQPQDVLNAVKAALDQVTGLRCHATHPGQVNTPAAVCEISRVLAPGTLGTAAEYTVRVALLVQVGDQRNSQERTLALIDPTGDVTESAHAALQDYPHTKQVLFEGPGLVQYGDQPFHGGVFTLEILA